MAQRSAAGPPSPALPFSSGLARTGGAHRPPVFTRQPSCRRRRAGCVRAAAQDDEAPPVVRAAVGAVTELLRALSPSKKQARQAVSPIPKREISRGFSTGGGRARPAAVRQRRGCARRARRRLPARLLPHRVAGDFTPGIYTEDCLFEDPTIKFRGRSRYSQNLNLLVPFFDSPSLELENIEKGLRVETKFVKATWKLRTYLRLPWRPLIAIRGNTTYDLNEDYKVVRHSESWAVSALEAIGQIFASAPEQQKGS
ncbi:unnamed protein product [Urochloa decumbens]|uniref:Uncharacterized protein n=1 Tax=Urochloa decumbens TaxID=240449 RepID=A0ABC9G9K9_9POAL